MIEKRKRVEKLWSKVKVGWPKVDRDVAILHVGDTFGVEVEVRLGELDPEDVDVEVYYGPVTSKNDIRESLVGTMSLDHKIKEGVFQYKHEIVCQKTGRYGFTARVIPRGEQWKAVMPGLITWAQEGS